MTDNSTKDKLENETPHFGNTLLYAVADLKKYDLIVIDPAWEVGKTQRKVRPNQKPELDYVTMPFDEIKALPIGEMADTNSVIFLWTIQKWLPKSFELLDTWGFKYQRTLTWDKKNGMCLFGFHHRTEFVLFGYRGKIEIYPKRKAIPTVFDGKSERHSAKPDEFYQLVQGLGKNRVDVFARREREGWDVFGNEVNNSIDLERYRSNGI